MTQPISLLRINIENGIKLALLVGILIYSYPILRDSLLIMFKNEPSKASNLLLAISTLVIGAMFAYFSFHYNTVNKAYWILRLLSYLQSFGFLLVIQLSLIMSSILFPIFVGGMEWLFKTVCYTIIFGSFIYDILNIQVIGKDY